jgi:hypothetical protein
MRYCVATTTNQYKIGKIMQHVKLEKPSFGENDFFTTAKRDTPPSQFLLIQKLENELALNVRFQKNQAQEKKILPGCGF